MLWQNLSIISLVANVGNSASAVPNPNPPAFKIGANQSILSLFNPSYSEAVDDEWESSSDSSLDENKLSWTACSCYFGHAEATFCINQGLFPEVFDTTWSAPSLEDLIENTELTLLIPNSLTKPHRDGSSI